MKIARIQNEADRTIIACQKRDTLAQKAVYERYAPVLMSICYRYVPNRSLATDLLHDSFIKIFTKIDSYSGEGSFEGWMKRIVVTTALEYLRDSKAKLLVSLDDVSYENEENNDTNALEKLSADDLLKCISSMPDGYRTIFNLYAIEGYSHAEIAEMLNITESTSRSQFMRARNLLQQKIKAFDI
jgi:RNA polymerase sigma-70 factor (ECF subfamily)